MPRPRIHDLDVVLDHAEALAVAAGVPAVTIRAVAAASGMSNGAIYHSFGSRAELVARMWIRAARRFLDVQNELVDEALADGSGSEAAVQAVVRAAEAPAEFAARYPASSRLVTMLRHDEVLAAELPESVAAEVRAQHGGLVAVMRRLSAHLWQREDRRAVEVITACIVDLPTALLLSRDRLADPDTRMRLRAAVRAAVSAGPPPKH
ncbi:TetR family transcriptional regulator [Nocardia nova]|uniref:helix-turn-helix domain-containing protein n=2 Tax=Nocardia nova TaxID=37330 RepID=UPI000CEA4D9A|nr:TetR family transcriptional regulator [Nocardia nova]